MTNHIAGYDTGCAGLPGQMVNDQLRLDQIGANHSALDIVDRWWSPGYCRFRRKRESTAFSGGDNPRLSRRSVEARAGSLVFETSPLVAPYTARASGTYAHVGPSTDLSGRHALPESHHR
jgi:hypothetical protein